MEDNQETGLFLDFDDCKALFRGLKKNEAGLSGPERDILRRIERILYTRLSIREFEELDS
ncbi:MAG: hypothetical protein LBC62_00685 [Treponema sp.]|jgi:hypothetical protein|nr:hypothetical protein [Treponema sp.]